MESELAPDTQETNVSEERPAKRRHRSAAACQRCKNRKQRCDNEFPSCSNCVSAGKSCTYGVKQIYPAEYVRSLESHIAELERTMAAADPNIAMDHLASTRGQGIQKESVESPDDFVAEGLEPSLEVGVGFVALSPNSYLGTSSGLPLAKLVKSAINVTSRGSPRREALDQRGNAAGSPHSAALSGSTRHPEPDISAGKVEMPSDEAGAKLISAYFSRVHPKHPFLSRKRISTLNKDRETLVPAHQSRSRDINANRLDYAILHLIYAIGARYLQLANDHSHSSPEVSLYSHCRSNNLYNPV